MRTPATAIRGVFVSFIVLGLVFISIINASGSAANHGDILALDETPTTSPTSPPPLLKIHLPLVLRIGKLELTGAWINNADGAKQYGFEPGDALEYVIELKNDTGFDTTSVKVTWDQVGPCEQKLVINQEFVLKPGTTQVIANEVASNCYGVYANSINLIYELGTESINFNSVVINTSSVIVASNQGFDDCGLPNASQMQTWWDESPYSTVNIYLGGVSAACPIQRDAGWLYDVSQQGWSFILTWVGPQAPCTSFNHPMSRNVATAKQQGRDNADAAVAKAREKGFLGDLVIYYDLESYSNGKDDSGCRAAVASFMQGWVERIHELDQRAGGYGAACTSFMYEWADNVDPPDDVWFAHWYTNDYDEDATVWDVPCIGNDLWANNQRLKQYAGVHNETWGGLKKSIDSNVLDGHVSAILDVPLPASSQLGSSSESSSEILKVSEPAIADFQLLTNRAGWALRGGNLYITKDGGNSWQDISPSAETLTNILGVHFQDSQQGWLVSKNLKDGRISLLLTGDGGMSWQEISTLLSKPEEVYQIASASLEFIDAQTGYIAFRLHSSINFSLGRLFATNDGGLTWGERMLPLGEPVKFLDSQRGWTSGGPLDEIYYTEDGGQNWNLTNNGSPEILSSESAGTKYPSQTLDEVGEALESVVALEMVDDLTGWAIVQDGSCTGFKPQAGELVPQGAPGLLCESSSMLMTTDDGGVSWRDISPGN
jgi:photosystem II stability/assembly factor-like uncharacterized protein